MIVVTAGHIDHGKSALVRALTGTDTDRLPEERARGITIELGYAFRDAGTAAALAFVDVPGHEALVRTMLAGATGGENSPPTRARARRPSSTWRSWTCSACAAAWWRSPSPTAWMRRG